MRANELRIGNYLVGRNGIVTVSAIQEDGTVWLKEGGKNFIVDSDKPCLLPIPLTEEWLVKFGFRQKRGLMCWEREGVEIVYETLANFYRFYPLTNKIQYVHQLQNLYFALTNEELTYEQ